MNMDGDPTTSGRFSCLSANRTYYVLVFVFGDKLDWVRSGIVDKGSEYPTDMNTGWKQMALL